MAVLGLRCCAWAFSICSEWGLISGYGVWASHFSVFSCRGAWALGVWAKQLWHTDLVTPRHARSFWTQGSNACLLHCGCLTTEPLGKSSKRNLKLFLRRNNSLGLNQALGIFRFFLQRANSKLQAAWATFVSVTNSLFFGFFKNNPLKM